MPTTDSDVMISSENESSAPSTMDLLDAATKAALDDPDVISLCVCVQHAPEQDPETGQLFRRALSTFKADPGVNMDWYVEDLAKTILTRLMTADPAYAMKFLEHSVTQFFDRMYAQLKCPTENDQDIFRRATMDVQTKLAESLFITLDFQSLLQSYCAQLKPLREQYPNIGTTESERVLDTMQSTYASPNYTTYRELIIRLVSDLPDDKRMAILEYVSENAHKYNIDTMDFEKFEEELKSIISTL